MAAEMGRFVRAALIAPRTAPVGAAPAFTRWQRTWFPGPVMGAISLLLLAVFVFAGWRFFDWAIVHAQWTGPSSESCPDRRGACWASVTSRWKPWLVGDYPSDQLWRAWACFAAFALFWTWVVRRSHGASLQRVLMGFVVMPVLF